jgi:hypothetical protein
MGLQRATELKVSQKNCGLLEPRMDF